MLLRNTTKTFACCRFLPTHLRVFSSQSYDKNHSTKTPSAAPFVQARNTGAGKLKTAADVLEFAKKNDVVMFDFKFTDLFGRLHHIQSHNSSVDLGTFENGLGFDGSSLRSWQPIDQSDMAIIPIPSSARLDSFTRYPTMSILCDVVDPVVKESYTRDPRYVARKAVEHLRNTGVAHDARFGPEVEFFVFDSIAYNYDSLSGHYEIGSAGSYHGSRHPHNDGYKVRQKEGYFPDKPWDRHQDLRTEMAIELGNFGIQVEAAHHEVAAAGQNEIGMRYDTLLEVADKLQWYKYVIRNVAVRNGKIVTFMPKPSADDNGSGMHVHISLHAKDGSNLFNGEKYAGLSDLALSFIAGVIKHSRSLLAFTNPTINSYKRLVPGFEAPVNMAYSHRNRSAAIRIPITPPKARRFEFRTPDPSSNPYLAFPAILMAGLDGVKNNLHPGEPLDKDIYSLSSQALARVPKAPKSLEEAIEALERDHSFLLDGNVFTQDLLEAWITRKRVHEIDPFRKLPTAFEFSTYFDC